tara:strand:- start:97 stop:744 length:648 start_codon:yes stop_codon:yes gene_type:complete
MIKGIFIDLDGTLIKSIYHHYLGWKKVLHDENIYISKKDFYFTEGKKLELLLKDFYIQNNKIYDPIKIKKLIEKKNKHFIKNFKLSYYPGAIKTIKYFFDNNYYLSIVTAGSKSRVLKTLPNEFTHMFNRIITGDDCKEGKPSPEPYLKALQHSKLDKKNCIILENAPLGLLSAKKAKIKCVGITNTNDSKLLHQADYIVNSFKEFKNLIEELNA